MSRLAIACCARNVGSIVMRVVAPVSGSRLVSPSSSSCRRLKISARTLPTALTNRSPVPHPNRLICVNGHQHLGGVLVHLLVFGRDRNESRMLAQVGVLLGVVPLAEMAPAMRGIRDITFVGRQTADQRAVHLVAPLLVHVQRLFQGRYRTRYLFLGHSCATRHGNTSRGGAAMRPPRRATYTRHARVLRRSRSDVIRIIGHQRPKLRTRARIRVHAVDSTAVWPPHANAPQLGAQTARLDPCVLDEPGVRHE